MLPLLAFVWPARHTADWLVLAFSVPLKTASQVLFQGLARQRSYKCNGRADVAMASLNPPAVNRPGKSRNKRFVQPAIPALPQLSTARKNDGRGAPHAEHVANESIQEASREESRRASTTASLELSNGVHKDEIPKTSGEDAVANIGASPDAPSPVSQPGRSSPMNAYLAHL